MADSRTCEQCGTTFLPRREHARFCSARCRVAWNDDHTVDLAAEESALAWSVTALHDTTERLLRAQVVDQARAFADISEAVWWVTIVDGTLVRYHPEAYDTVLAAMPAPDRVLVEGTLAGLRFVRNQIGQALAQVDFIHNASQADPQDRRLTAWVWKNVPEPDLEALSARGQEWELSRYLSYEAHLAGRRVVDTFGRAAPFLNLVAAAALPADAPDTTAASS